MRKLWIIAVVIGLMLGLACKKHSEKVESELATAQKIANLEQEINDKQDNMNQLLRQYSQEGGEDVGEIVGQTLTPEQKAILEEKLKSEQGIGYEDLIDDILKKQEEVENLKVQVQEMEKKLPMAVVVNRGDTHMGLAEDFLTKEKGLSVEEARKLIERVNVMDELVPGFKVWNFYDEGVFGTFVTQGEATVSPYRVVRRAKEKLISEKDEAVSQSNLLKKEKATLTEQVAELEVRRNQLNEDVAMLHAERDEMLGKLQNLQDLSTELESQVNSVFYRVGDRNALVGMGIIKDPVFGRTKLASYDSESYPNRLDLRTGDTIEFTAKGVGVTKVWKVQIIPTGTFKNKVDYNVIIAADGQTGAVQLLDIKKFQTERTCVVVIN